MRVVVLAPMPLELNSVVAAFGLSQVGDEWRGRLGGADVSAVHIGMGPPAARQATARILDRGTVDHIMIAGICGGIDPEVDVGTLVNPEVVVDHTTGAAFAHNPPGTAARAGKLVTTEGVSLDADLSRSFLRDGFVGVDMETSGVAEVCAARGIAWSVYRCISDRWCDGLLDERVVGMANPDGSANMDRITELLAADPSLGPKLERLGRDSALAAQRAAEAAVAGCRAL